MKDASRQAEAPERVKGWRRWLRVPHVPTSVILTLLGIALTAWLLPAFTRQWDDRQKERELKAALVSDIASATAETLIATTKEARALNEQIDGEPVPFDPDRLDAVWLRNNVMLDAKLHAYFASSDVDAALRDYTTMMQRMVDVEMLRIFPDEYSLRPFGFSRKEQAGAITDLAPTTQNGWRQCMACGFAWLKLGVLRREKLFVRTVLNAHATGYSTTTRDLINDLLPF